MIFHLVNRNWLLGSLRNALMLSSILLICLIGCSGGEDSADSNPISPEALQPSNFDVVYERQLSEDEVGGLLAPMVTAKADSGGNVHILFYTSGDTLDVSTLPAGSDIIANPNRFNILHYVWNPTTGALVSSAETIPVTPPHTNDSPVAPTDQGIDNIHILGLAFDQGVSPVVVYQGGARAQSEGGLSCNPFYQGDLMVAVRQGGVWQEYLGIQGDASVKNPLFTDGLVGTNGDVVVDSSGVVHMIAQHYYEACDLHSTTFPDLLYVQQNITNLGNFQISMEEWPDEHNTYGAGGGIQNAMGYACKLILDQDEQPVAFYFGVLSSGERVLRVSRRLAGQWQAETVVEIDDDYTIGHISPAVSSDGVLSVAYFLQSISEDSEFGDHLCYALQNEEGQWQTTMVDYASYCGNYCTLTMDAAQQPAIVYYDERPYTAYRERKDVKLARFDGRFWHKEIAATDGEVGFYNSIWFDAANTAYICTYDQEGKKIMVLRRRI